MTLQMCRDFRVGKHEWCGKADEDKVSMTNVPQEGNLGVGSRVFPTVRCMDMKQSSKGSGNTTTHLTQ
jgi:hypothetical protein